MQGAYWDEQKVARIINEYRYATELGRGNSFETIAAYGPNGAKPHYEISNTTNIPINDSSTLVLDSGGQYLGKIRFLFETNDTDLQIVIAGQLG